MQPVELGTQGTIAQGEQDEMEHNWLGRSVKWIIALKCGVVTGCVLLVVGLQTMCGDDKCSGRSESLGIMAVVSGSTILGSACTGYWFARIQ